MVNGQALYTVIVRANALDEYARAPRVKAEMSFMTVAEVVPKKVGRDERIDFSDVFYIHRPQATASCPVCQAWSGDYLRANPATKKELLCPEDVGLDQKISPALHRRVPHGRVTPPAP